MTIVYARWGTPELQVEETADDSDKTITVPDKTQWRVLWIWIEYVATATVGNRILQIDIRDPSDDVIYSVTAVAAIVASATEYARAVPSDAIAAAETVAGFHTLPLPHECILPAGYDIRIYDSAAIAAAADDMVVQMMVEERPE